MLFDTYAWVELFRGTEKGARVRELLEKEPAFSSAAIYAELTTWALRNGLEPEEYLARLERLSSVLPLDREVLLAAGRITHQRKKSVGNWSRFDGLVYATARLHALSVVTGDEDFRGLPDVILI